MKSYDNAIVYSEQELAIRREVKDRFGEASALYSLAVSERAKDNLVSAQRHIEQSLNLQETLRSNEINDPDNRASFLSEVQSSYELYTELLMAQHKAEPANGFDRRALEVSERHRARSLLDLLTEAGTDIREGVDNALLERERLLRRQLNDKAQRLFRASKPELIAALKQDITQLETVERMIRRGVYKGPLVMNWVAIGGGMDAPNIYNLANFLRATPDGAMLTLESSMLNVLPVNMMAIAMGLHVRCGIEDNLWTQDRKSKMSTVKQIEQLVRISREFGREIATGKEAKQICKIGTFYSSIDETLAKNGFAPNRKPEQRASLQRAA